MYTFSRKQAGQISGFLSDNGLTLANLKAALATFAPDYPVKEGGREVHHTEVHYTELADGSLSVDGTLLVVNDAGYDFVRLPNSNSDGIVISHYDNGQFYGTMDVEGMRY